ncbi:hypothetical protein, partial [Psychromonas sp. Urea-02u-13]|uniref:hypothetical protein n=1 Tax=Psychromonas sp. Urea-02u-13 TaxID=2058326 RepID=UPI000CA7E5CC
FCPIAVVTLYKGYEQMGTILNSTLYKFGCFIRFVFFFISIIFATHLFANLYGGGLMPSFFSIPCEKDNNKEGCFFTIETETEYGLAVDVEEYGQKKVSIEVFKILEREKIAFLKRNISTHSKNKNSTFFKMNLREGDYYFHLPANKLISIRLSQQQPTSKISQLFYDLDRNMLAGYMSLITGTLSIFYMFYFILYFLPTLVKREILSRWNII